MQRGIVGERPGGNRLHGADGAGEEVKRCGRGKRGDERLLPNITVLPYDVAVARVYGEVQVRLAELGESLADADLQIAATAIHHGLELVTGNLRHFDRVPGLRIHRALIDARSNPA